MFHDQHLADGEWKLIPVTAYSAHSAWKSRERSCRKIKYLFKAVAMFLYVKKFDYGHYNDCKMTKHIKKTSEVF